MTRKDAIMILDCERPYGSCGCGASDEEIEEALNMAIKCLEQESILNKIYTDIQSLRGCSCGCSDGIIDDVEDILDKYRN